MLHVLKTYSTTSCYLEKSRDPNFLNLTKRLREKYSCLSFRSG